MVKIFGTRTWGFSPESQPFVSFVHNGNRASLLSKSTEGDLVLVVGTYGDETHPNDQGRLLGLVEFGRSPVFADDLLMPNAIREARSFDADGKFKWPHALPALRAWRFPAKPSLEDVVGRQLSMAATTGTDELSSDEAERVLKLPRQNVTLPKTKAILRSERAAPSGKSSRQSEGYTADKVGPPPSEWSRVVSRLDGPTYVYLAQYGEHEVFKVGISKAPSERLNALNFGNPNEVTNAKWELVLTQQSASGMQAYKMEQHVLSSLKVHGTSNERVRCSFETVERVWIEYLSGA